MFESRNICDLGLLQNARTHGPRGAVKTIEQYFLHRTQVHYFCSGNSNQDPKGIFLKMLGSQQRSTANSNLRKQNLTSLDVHQINYFFKATTCDMWLGALYTPRIFQGVGVPCFNHSSSGLLCATEQHQHFQVR